MVREDRLSSVLSEFARTMITDFPIQAILDRLVHRIVEVLPVTGAGVTLIAPGTSPQYIAASNASALRFERLQSELGQGPCVVAYQTGDPVAVPDVAAETRFPSFTLAALDAGMRAVFTFPLRHRDRQLGALDLYRNATGALDADDMTAAQTLADVTAAYLINAQARDRAREASERFRAAALHDALTGLPNRVLLGQRLQHVAQRAQRSHTTVAVLFADLDQFKWINDTHGHAVGDMVLIEVARRLSAVMRPGDTLARVSGDEFVILCEDLSDAGDAEKLASRVQVELEVPFDLVPPAPILVSASVGIAYAGPGESVTDQLIADADTAMYQAKRSGGAVHRVLDLTAAKAATDRHRLEVDLHTALAGDQLTLVYQPVVRTSDGLLTGVEALLRWNHPRQGPVTAATAVGIAEQNGLITPIGAWVLEQACVDRTRWAARHPGRKLELSVNVSGRQLMEPGFCDTVRRALTTTGMDPGALQLELTEGVCIDDPQRARTVLQDLRGLGVRLALDDFGTGFCSLTYLHQFPIDMLKIDQSFVAKLHRDRTALDIAAAVTELAHVLGMSVTAEGVETQQQHHNVLSIGCELSQGFLYAQPLTGSQMNDLLTVDPDRSLRLPATTALSLSTV